MRGIDWQKYVALTVGYRAKHQLALASNLVNCGWTTCSVCSAGFATETEHPRSMSGTY